MDTGKGGGVLTRQLTLSTRSAEGKMPRPARSAFHDLYQIYQVLSLHIPQWSSNDALIVWRNVSGRFLGPIELYTDRKSASASRLSRRLVDCQHVHHQDSMAVSGLYFFLLISI